MRTALDVVDRFKPSVLGTEGLWRENGAKDRVDSLARLFEVAKSAAVADAVRKALGDGEIHEVLGAIKAILTKHQPLTTYAWCDDFIAATAAAARDAKSKLKRLIEELPPLHRQLLGRFATHAKRVVERSKENRMTWQALAIALAPTLLRSSEAERGEIVTLEAVDDVRARADALAIALERTLVFLARRE